jgi:uncharacterized membrane protein YphA (DoxX/SURF4 family)
MIILPMIDMGWYWWGRIRFNTRMITSSCHVPWVGWRELIYNVLDVALKQRLVSKMSHNPFGHTYTDVALLAVRLILGFELLWHGLPKLINPASAAEKFVNWGFPGILASIVGALEVGAALLILVGYLIPVAVVVAGSIIIVALLTVQIPKGGVHAALERDILILITMMVLLAFGPGRFALADRLPQLTPFSRGTQG